MRNSKGRFKRSERAEVVSMLEQIKKVLFGAAEMDPDLVVALMVWGFERPHIQRKFIEELQAQVDADQQSQAPEASEPPQPPVVSVTEDLYPNTVEIDGVTYLDGVEE